MSTSLALKYGAMIGTTVVLFTNFVACGAQMYQVSLRDDHNPAQAAEGSDDPESQNFGLHAPGGWDKLPIKFRTGFKVESNQLGGLQSAMKTWEIAVGRPLFVYEGVHENVDGDTFPDLYSSLKDSINGNYLDFAWQKTGKSKEVIATTIWTNSSGNANKIDSADIRFNEQEYVIGDGYSLKKHDVREVVDMQTLALHELGHLLGLAHIEAASDSSSIMNPKVYIGEGLTSRSLSRGDLERIQKIYGCQNTSCDLDKTARQISMLANEYSSKSSKSAKSSGSSNSNKVEEEESGTSTTY